MALMRRVVVTGVGCVSPVGGTAPATWQALSEGRCGIRKVADVPGFYDGWENPEGTGMQCLVAGAVADDDGAFKDQSRVSRATAMALRAVDEAVRSSGDLHERLVDGGEGEEVGVAFGTGMSSLMDIAAVARNLDKGAAKRVSPFFVPKILCNAAAGQIGIRYGLHGPNHSASTACATGAHGIGDGFRLIQHGDADVMLCGGTESCLNPIAFAGFQRAKAMTTQHNETPHTASSPFAPSRSGFVMSEGAGAVVLEELEHAVRRGAPILAEVVGYGLSGDGYHVTSPHPEALGMRLCMARALREAERLGCDPSTVSYVNAHATSTPMGDELEAKAIDEVMAPLLGEGRRVAVSSTKGHLGHLLGAAGAVEAIVTLKALQEGKAPPTLNLAEAPASTCIDYVVGAPGSIEQTCVVSNSFGFGGTNTSLVFKKLTSA